MKNKHIDFAKASSEDLIFSQEKFRVNKLLPLDPSILVPHLFPSLQKHPENQNWTMRWILDEYHKTIIIKSDLNGLVWTFLERKFKMSKNFPLIDYFSSQSSFACR